MFYIFLSLLISLTSCTSKGYVGPSQDSSVVSNISVHGANQVEIKNINIDNNVLGIFSTSLDTLEGEHAYSINYSLKSIESCQPEYRQCRVRTSFGLCTGKIRTLPGRNYLVTITGKNGNVSISTLAKGYYDFSVREEEGGIGFGTCSEQSYSISIEAERS